MPKRKIHGEHCLARVYKSAMTGELYLIFVLPKETKFRENESVQLVALRPRDVRAALSERAELGGTK